MTEHKDFTVSMTRAELQESLTEARRQRDEAIKQRDVLNAAAQSMVDWFDKLESDTFDAVTKWDPEKWEGLGDGFDINILRRAIPSVEKSS